MKVKKKHSYSKMENTSAGDNLVLHDNEEKDEAFVGSNQRKEKNCRKGKKNNGYLKTIKTSIEDTLLHEHEETETSIKGMKTFVGSNQRKEKNCRMGKKNDGNLKTTKMPTEDTLLHEHEKTETSIKGMKKWLLDYHSKRPGLKELQRRIDDFIVDYEAKAEKERKERDAAAAADGWTVVTHMKGRKKNVDLDTGIAVGSVSEAAVQANQVKKKSDGTVMDFYRFQRREARRNAFVGSNQRKEKNCRKGKKNNGYLKTVKTSIEDTLLQEHEETETGIKGMKTFVGSNQRKEKNCRKGKKNNGILKTTKMPIEDTLLQEHEETETGLKGMKK